MSLRPLFVLLFFILATAAVATENRLPGSKALAGLHGRHPRLLLNEEGFSAIANRRWDPLGQEYREFLSEAGLRMVNQEPVAFEFVGRRLLSRSQRVLKRVMALSLLYRIEGKEEFRDQAIRELESAVSFPTWNPAHFLDTGELALAVSIGTD